MADNLIGDLAIQRGATYDKWRPQAPGDWRLWTPKSQIRDNLLSVGGELKTAFDFGETEYDAESDLSTFKPFLTPEKTLSLPITKYQGDPSEPSVKNCFVTDLQVELDGVIYSCDVKFVQVKGEVTANA